MYVLTRALFFYFWRTCRIHNHVIDTTPTPAPTTAPTPLGVFVSVLLARKPTPPMGASQSKHENEQVFYNSVPIQVRRRPTPTWRTQRTHLPLAHLGLLRPGHSTLRHLPLPRSHPHAPRPPRPSHPRQNRRRSRTPPRARRRKRRGQQQRRRRRRHRPARNRSRVGAREPRP